MKKLPKNRKEGYLRALEIASNEFAQRDPEMMARASKASYQQENNIIKLPLLNDCYHVHHPSARVIKEKDQQEASVAYRVLLLHYLLEARGIPLKNSLISFKEVEGGMVYFDAFRRRAIKPLVNVFGQNPEKMVAAGKKLGGEELDLADAALVFKVLPAIPITYALWMGEDNISPRASILFDASVKAYLPMEDLALLASIPVWGMLS